FISGAFIPMEFLSKNVIAMAKFTPSYWYAYTNNLITSSNTVDNSVMLNALFWNLLFTSIFIIVTIFFNRRYTKKD
ncbi:MAG: ABC transporter permease, partial [Bacilli bacterium]